MALGLLRFESISEQLLGLGDPEVAEEVEGLGRTLLAEDDELDKAPDQ
jgi:hypothetical protein